MNPMNKISRYIPAITKICFLVVVCFSVSCISVCAQSMSTERAKELREMFVLEAKKHVGAEYVYGAVGPDTFDCSGLIYYCAREATQIQLPRTARAIYNFVNKIEDNELENGDLLFFKTTNSGTISHIGIYIGNRQFISAISDGPNTGVIVSSLNQPYWKPKYVAAGRFLKSGISKEERKKQEKSESEENSESSNIFASSSHTSNEGFLNNLVLDSTLTGNWSLLSPKKFVFQFRGVDLWSNVRFAKWVLEPGLGFGLRYDFGLGVFQIPITMALTLNDYFRIYAGPVITMGTPQLMDIDKELKGSIFPGILGISFSTPAIKIAKSKVQVVQDISYTIYNDTDGAALPFLEAIPAGLVMYTGLRITMPFSIFTGNK